MKHVLIIGGTAGIGRALASNLFAEGANVTIAGRDRDRALAASREIEQSIAPSAGQIAGIAADLSKPEGLRASLAGPTRIDHLVLVGMMRDGNTISPARRSS